MKISVIGTGNMGGAIVRALCRAAGAEQVFITNRTRAKAEALADELGCTVCDTDEACAAGADFVFLGVKPAGIRDVITLITPQLKADAVLVSMAAGVTGAAMREALGGGGNPIVRILPNTPCAIGRGLVLIAPCGDVAERTLSALEALLAPCGQTGFLTEAQADAGMTVGGCTPAYTYLFLEALADGGVRCGLPRADALAWAAQAVAGAAELLLQSGQHPGALKDAVCSPGGSTIEGVRALENAAFRGAVMDAVSAAFFKDWNRSR